LKGALPVDVSAPSILVDFAGGRINAEIRGPKGTTPRAVSDETGIEVLLYDPYSGKLRCRNFWTDMGDTERYEREQSWSSWIKSIKEGTDKKDSGNPFDKPGGGKPGGQ